MGITILKRTLMTGKLLMENETLILEFQVLVKRNLSGSCHMSTTYYNCSFGFQKQ